MNPDFGFGFLTWEQCCWVALALDVAAIALAVVSRLVSGRLGWLALPIWLVTIPSALLCHNALTPDSTRVSEWWVPWLLSGAPIVSFGSCVSACKNRKSWIEYMLVGTMLASLSLSMWCAILEAAAI